MPIRFLFIEIRGRCLMANLCKYNTIVNILLGTVTLKSILKWVTNLARLCLAKKGNFLTLERYEKLWWHSISSQKLFLQWKIPKGHNLPHLMEQHQIGHGGVWHMWSYNLRVENLKMHFKVWGDFWQFKAL